MEFEAITGLGIIYPTPLKNKMIYRIYFKTSLIYKIPQIRQQECFVLHLHRFINYTAIRLIATFPIK
jgi:hypothetical protein